jgi:aryl-alcohol dehydrogenase-like predicted oxidoreductase
LPFNLAMPEAFTNTNQSWQGDTVSLFEAARRAQIAVIGSATLYQARLTQNLPEKVRKKLAAGSDLEAAIQFARSAPGITTSLIGMSKMEHVAANLKAASGALVAREEWLRLFQE